MAIDQTQKFRFVSPGIFIDEIDRSQLPKVPGAIGPVVIGRAERGPGLAPIKVDSYLEFVNVFGAPDRGVGSDDVWRNGNNTAPTYGAYAAQAYLKNSSPLTFVRLLGAESPDATGDGAAGWQTKFKAFESDSPAANGGAYGLFLIPSGTFAADTAVDCPLAAVFYVGEGKMRLVGETPSERTVAPTGGEDGCGTFVQTIGSDFELEATIFKGDGSVEKRTTFNFNENSYKYIRRVFNTNPTLTNETVTPAEGRTNYWLGETFDNFVKNKINTNLSDAGEAYGCLVPLDQAGAAYADQRQPAQAAASGWVISQDLNTITASFDASDMTKLFKFHALGEGAGEWEQNNIKISITDIKTSTNPLVNEYGSFTVLVRQLEDDKDATPIILEQYTECSLNPAANNYVANKIGDKSLEWSDSERRYTTLGSYANNSKYVRIEMNPDIEIGGVDPRTLPFGAFGPLKLNTVAVASGSSVEDANSFLQGSGSSPDFPTTAIGSGFDIDISFSGSFLFPEIPLVATASETGVPDFKDAYYGIDVTKSGSFSFDEGYRDYVKVKPKTVANHTEDDSTDYQWTFTLDDVVAITGSSGAISDAYYEAGSRLAGTSISASGSLNYESTLDAGATQFTIPLFGGSDGLNLTEKEPFRNTGMDGQTEQTSYAYYSIKRAIDSVSDPEVIEMNVATVPGITNTGLTDHLLNTCESRADSLAIIDPEGGYVPASENDDTEAERSQTGVDEVVQNIRLRGLNTSYGCAYYPWVQIRDRTTNFPLYVPPSVVALGTMASSQESTAVWFAPAGFNRGGLSEGSAGITVTDVKDKLTAKKRDKLYEHNINPIASFPSEGIVIFGQKTLQSTPSALDRINVRRLLIFLKKGVSNIASRILFDQNVQVTWDRFTSQVNPYLDSVKSGLGLTDYKVLLDETTTTPDLIDRNILYAKIFLKPARAIEFIALDFVITRTGASFDD